MNERKKSIPEAFQDVRLLDGRSQRVSIYGRTTVGSDHEPIIFDFSWRRDDIEWHESAVKILLGMMSTHSLIYASRCTYYTKRFEAALSTRGSPKQYISVEDLSCWVETIGLAAWPFFQALLGRWVQSGYAGLDDDVKAFLRSPEKFEEKGNGWYFALVANDPERGAFTEQELRSVRDGVNEAFETGKISLKDWAMTWFLIATGVRPIQIARTTLADVLVNIGPDGQEVTLCIPLAKGENQIVKDRWKRKAPTVLSEALILYLQSLDLTNLRGETPLFDDQSVKIARRLKRVFLHANTYSDRLESSIPIFPYRFRYTLGTRALAQGASDYEVARLLTHRTIHCIQYYRASLAMIQRPITKAMGAEMTFMAHAFQGRLIGTIEEATRSGQPGAVIRDFAHLMGQSLGACGTCAKCYQDAPRACLTCIKFEPFRDAPWELFLKVLVEDRDRETEDRIREITEIQVSAVHDMIALRDAPAVGAVLWTA